MTLRDLLSLVRDPGGPYLRNRGIPQILLSSAQPRLQPARISARFGKPAADRTAESGENRIPSAEQGADLLRIAKFKFKILIVKIDSFGVLMRLTETLRRYREAPSLSPTAGCR